MREKNKHNRDESKWDDFILKRYFGGDVGPEMEDIIRGWLADGHRQDEKWERVGKIFDSTVHADERRGAETMSSLAEVHGKLGFPARKDKKPNRLRGIVLGIVSAAAVVAVAVFVMWPESTVTDPVEIARSAGRETIRVVTTDKDRTVVLPDSTVVELKPSTTFEYSGDFLDNREVFLEGEGYFRVKKLGGKPFVVSSNEVTVTVLGTEFNMKAYSDEAQTEIMLVTGQVSVARKGEQDETLMEPGQQYVYDKAHGTVELLDISEDEIMSFRGMGLYFREETLETVLRGVAMHHGKVLKVQQGVDLDRVMVVDLTDNETLEDAMFILENTSSDFNYEIGRDTITIFKRR